MCVYDSMYCLIKMNKIGTELFKLDFNNLREVARFLNVSLKHVNHLLDRQTFERGRYHVLNKYILYELKPEDLERKLLIEFNWHK